MVDGSLVIQEGTDMWEAIPRTIASFTFEVSCQRSYNDTLPPMSDIFKLMKKRWGDACIEVAQFFASGKLLPAGSEDFCRSLSVVVPVSTDIRSFLSTIAMDRTVLRNVQIVHNSVSVAPNVQLLDQCSISSSSSDDSMYFDNLDTAATSFSLPATATPDVTEALAQLRASIEKIKGRDDARFDEQDRVFRELRKYSHDQKHLLSLDIKSSQKQLSAQAAAAAIDVDVEATKEAISHQILDFRAQAQENYNILTSQLSELVAYINRGGNDKKGEDSSSRGPQPPPDDQERPGGGSASRGSGSGGDGRRRGDSGRSSKRRRSGESPPRNVRYGPHPPTGVPKRSAEHWVLGKKDF
ncbi:hypothetical protein F511_43365 [Dorcoceras hygrometricum]|uniref:Uncharacterized protein n=1 Tax=Dorcoceras hygrometricum TaxID=472368 RepID=A0A2Z7ADI5_9LAMI|nr:hypothetical protein F511_43365 [Dorcoceras hygrometricum]